jgi:hypothetical protein
MMTIHRRKCISCKKRRRETKYMNRNTRTCNTCNSLCMHCSCIVNKNKTCANIFCISHIPTKKLQFIEFRHKLKDFNALLQNFGIELYSKLKLQTHTHIHVSDNVLFNDEIITEIKTWISNCTSSDYINIDFDKNKRNIKKCKER